MKKIVVLASLFAALAACINIDIRIGGDDLDACVVVIDAFVLPDGDVYDMSSPVDTATPVDMSSAPDMAAVPDMAVVVDMAMSPDMALLPFTVTTSFPIPTQDTTLASDQGNVYPIFIPSYGTNVRALIGNLLPVATGGHSSPTVNAAWNTSDPTASNKVTGTGVTSSFTVPAENFAAPFYATGVASGADSKLVLSVGSPSGAVLVSCPLTHHGWKIDGDATVSPLPDPSSESVVSLYWILIQYDVPGGTTVTLSLGDSIDTGSTTGSDAEIRSTGYEDTAMYRIAQTNNAAIGIFAQPGAKMDHWVTTGSGTPYTRLWDYVEPQVALGAQVFLPLGTNDTPDGAAAMESRLTALTSHLFSSGASAVSASTILPAYAYHTTTQIADRATHNEFRTDNSLGFTALFVGGPAVPDTFTSIADPWDITVINRGNEGGAPAYGIDGTHLDTDGQQTKAATILGTYTPVANVNTLFLSSDTPQNVVDTSILSPPGARECGLGLDSYTPGNIRGGRFWKDSGETGSHTINLWKNGVLVATKPVSGETSSGWQQQAFDSPVAYTPFDVYVISVNYNVKIPNNTAPPLSLQKFRNNLRAFYNDQPYVEAYATEHYVGGSFFGTTLGAYPSPLPVDGETFMVDVDFEAL